MAEAERVQDSEPSDETTSVDGRRLRRERNVAAVIDAPGLYRFPGLGTVVNMVTPTPDEP